MSVTRLGLSVFALVLAGSGAAIAGPCDAELAMVRSERPNLAMEGHRRYAECVQKNNVSLKVEPTAKHACDSELAMMRSERPNLAMEGHRRYAECVQKNKIVGDAGPAAAKGACDASLTQMRSERPSLSSSGAQDYYACMQKSAAR